MPMTSPNKIMGKVKVPTFFKGTESSTKESPIKRNLPVLLALVLLGVAIILFLRSRSSSSTGPALSLTAGSAPDQSTIDNLTASILALQGQVTTNPTTPSGGSSTPITPNPSTTNPGIGTGSGAHYDPVKASYDQGYGTNAAWDLAQWLEVAKTGTFLPNASGGGLSILPGTARDSISANDLAQGLANAKARATAAGVTQVQLATAQSDLAKGLQAGNYNPSVNYIVDPVVRALSQADMALSGGKPYSTAQLSYMNYTGGYTLENLTKLKSDPKFKSLA